MSGPLEGIKVVECATWMQGPIAAATLGDLGADVVKIEERGRGDPYRSSQAAMAADARHNLEFEMANRNKRGIALDLRKPQGRDLAIKLIQKSDVFIHNLRPRAARKYRLDYDAVSPVNARLIYAQASGWGLKGPESELGALDYAVAGRVGVMYTIGEPEVPLPQPWTNGIIDSAGGMCLTLGVLAALQARERTGVGQMVDSSLLGSAIALITYQIGHYLSTGSAASPRRFRLEKRNPLATYYKCGDGEYIRFCMSGSDKYWPGFCEAMGITYLQNDYRFASHGSRDENAVELIKLLDKVFAAKPRSEWLKRLATQDLAYAPIQKVSDLPNDPQVVANEYLTAFDHPIHGPTKVVGFPYKLHKTPASLRRPAPEFGQHTEEVLLELGYTWDNIATLKEQEVI